MKLDLIFSIGPACRPAYYLKINFLRIFACPLDWQMNYSLDTCLDLFRTNFQTFFSEIQENTHKKGAHNNRRIIDTFNSIISIHHFDMDTPIAKAHADFRSVMTKRYEQLHNAILKSHTVGLICNRDDTLDDLSAFLLSFGQIYPNIKFVLINIRTKEGTDSISMNEYKINSLLTIREYAFCDRYTGAEYGDQRTWIGNFDAWNNVLQDYYLNEHPFASYVEHAVSTNQSIHLYGAGVYCRKIIHFLAKYNLEISDIIVTHAENNPDSIGEIPVITYRQVTEQYHTDLIIISIVNQEESLNIYHMLKLHGFQSVIRVDPLLRIIP